MDKYEKFLFFYSIIAITVFLISYGIFSPRPINFLSGILMLPIVFYFWIKLTNPEKITPLYWSFRFIFVLVLIAILGIGAYFYALKNPIPTKDDPQIAELNNKIQTLTNKIDSINATPSATQIPLPTSNADITYLITPKISVIGNDAVSIYESSDTGSKVVGSLMPGQSYIYTDKQQGFYKVITNDSIYGWVDGKLVKEVN